MNAVYNHRQHKLFTNALSCLSRFSDKLSIRCSQPDESTYAIRLSAINPAGSAFCAFCFLPEFFDFYELDSDRRRADLVLNIRALQNVLKTQFNKKLEKCELTLIDDETESRLAIRLHSFNGVTKTHKLTYEDQKCLFPASTEEGSKIVIDAKTVQGLLEHFGSRTNGEIALICKRQDMIIKSRNDDFVDRSAKMGKSVWTEVKVDARHFKTYKIKAEVELTFALREFKAAIALADHLMLPLELSFSLAGGPLMIKVQCPAMIADVFIATSPAVEQDTESQGTEERHDSQTSHRQQRQETEVEDGELDDLGRATEMRDESEVIHSGRSAIQNLDVPLQSTAPRGHPQREESPLQIATLPRDSSRSPSPPRNGLFLGESSPPREESNDVVLEREFEEASKAAEAQEAAQQEQRKQSQAAVSASQPAFLNTLDFEEATIQESETLRGDVVADDQEEGDDDEEEEEFAATDNEEEEEEEIPSTQQEASSKRAKYVPLY